MMDTQIYKEHYQFEWEHRSYLVAALNIPIGVITILGGGTVAMVQSYAYSSNLWSFAFIGFIGFAIISMGVASLFLFRAFSGYSYQRIPTPLKLDAHYKALLKWHSEVGHRSDEAEKDFDDEYHMRLAEAAEVNAGNNKRRSAFLYNCNTSLAISLCFIVLAAVPFMYQRISNRHQISPYRVEIVSPVELKQTELAMTKNESPKQEPEKSELPPTPAKPTMPPNESVKEHVIPPSGSETLTEHKH
jgi:hypothetical protein